MIWKRIYALFVARNTEFFRDRSALAWSILLPILIIFVFAYAFTDKNPEKFKVAYLVSEDIVTENSWRPVIFNLFLWRWLILI
jgi:hypothetical protein